MQLDANASRASAQLQALAHHYFTQGFERTPSGLQRADPLDSGPQYRNALGLPGGTNSTHYPAVVRAAAAVGMPLRQGVGGPDHDEQDEGVVWVYVSAARVGHHASRLTQTLAANRTRCGSRSSRRRSTTSSMRIRCSGAPSRPLTPVSSRPRRRRQGG